MALAPITEKQRKCVKDDVNLDDTQMKKKVEQIHEWMKKQPHLPQIPDDFRDKMISTFLLGTKLSTEAAKQKIDTCYSMRHQMPEIFFKRDPTQQDVRDSIETIRFFPLSELTPDGIRVLITSYNSAKDRRFSSRDTLASYKHVLNIMDVMVHQGEFCRGHYVVYDCRGFYMSHITEMPWLQVQRFVALCQEGLPIRVKGVFLFHAPGYVETALNILKPAFKEKLKKRIHVFQGDHTSLYKFIPQRILPSDFGGEAPSVEESSRAWQKTTESMRDFFLEEEKRKSDETKRPKGSTNDSGQMFGINGTFNKLTID